MLNSLKARLLLAAFFLLLIFLTLAGYGLNQAFYNSIRSAETERLILESEGLLRDSDPIEGQIVVNRDAAGDIDEGLIAFISGADKQIFWQSSSANLYNGMDGFLNKPVLEDYGVESGQWENYFYIRSVYIWEDDDENEITFQVTVLSLDDVLKEKQREFQKTIFIWLGGLAVFLWVTLAVIIFWGLKPLKRLAIDVANIHKGDAQSLAGDYPYEVLPVTENLNELIEAERSQRDRYRKTMGDLAHSLKTPLAVIKGCDQDVVVIHEQVDRMDQIISYQLGRAVVSSQHQMTRQIAISPIIQRICNALRKAYRDKQVEMTFYLSDVSVAMDEPDLMEVLGNIIENAFKYGDGKIQISVFKDEMNDKVLVAIEDNGAGVDEANRQVVLERGERLDTVQSGQGIGLSVVMEVLSSYQCGIKIEESESLGGAKFILEF